MNIHCMSCGHSIELGSAYETYQGPLRCVVCKTLMTVRIEEGQLRSMAPADTLVVPEPPQPIVANPN
ncbi:MAG: hypothetical protein KFB96_05340 [Thiocapsa sp.]|uniref:hypothetical protein n=1 Tax=Thiocapsa sp. TaxID=2024551 RepID=UPI001BCC134C|nr:hypothetical protein [Thiocapsa sp.]QVL49906.1 MAG: hypothetical protein KFB96_05340 [Thiocapsa sp.]